MRSAAEYRSAGLKPVQPSPGGARPGTKQELQDVCIGHGNDSRPPPAGGPDHLAQEGVLEPAAYGRALRLVRSPTFRFLAVENEASVPLNASQQAGWTGKFSDNRAC